MLLRSVLAVLAVPLLGRAAPETNPMVIPAAGLVLRDGWILRADDLATASDHAV